MRFIAEISIVAVALLAIALQSLADTGNYKDERFVSIDGMAICGESLPSEAVLLAVSHFNNEIMRMTHKPLPVVFGSIPTDGSRLVIGNRAAHKHITSKYFRNLSNKDEDILNQSYMIEVGTYKGNASINALGFGKDKSPRAVLGMSYALGDLLRRLNIRDGKWGFVFSNKAIIEQPSIPDRRFYLMNTVYINPGLALERFNQEQIENYVDTLIDARYSQVTFFQWSTSYLYPGSFESLRPLNQMTHRAMRRFLDYARRRGLQTYQMITPAHVEANLISDNPRFEAEGFYKGQGACWSQPEVRDLAHKVAQLEMEYYGPVDGYTVWFYDPGGCFCSECKPNQADRIFDQLMLVDSLSKTISPNAKMEAVLWPTWVFEQTKGIDYTKEEVKALVESFLEKCLNHYGKRSLSVMDTATMESSNIYNGLVDKSCFTRNALLHSVMGATIEQAYPFAYLRFGYTHEYMAIMQKNQVEAGTFTIGYATTNIPIVYVFANSLYDGMLDYDSAVSQYAASVAKGNAFEPYFALLKADDMLFGSGSYKDMDNAITIMENMLSKIESSETFYGNKDWLRGFVKARRWYWKLAQASSEESFDEILSQLKADVGAIPMYSDYMHGYEKINKDKVTYAAGHHTVMYWRSMVGDNSIIGAQAD